MSKKNRRRAEEEPPEYVDRVPVREEEIRPKAAESPQVVVHRKQRRSSQSDPSSPGSPEGDQLKKRHGSREKKGEKKKRVPGSLIFPEHANFAMAVARTAIGVMLALCLWLVLYIGSKAVLSSEITSNTS